MPTAKFWFATAVALCIGVSGCELLAPMSAPKVAERDPDNPQTASANISSLQAAKYYVRGEDSLGNKYSENHRTDWKTKPFTNVAPTEER